MRIGMTTTLTYVLAILHRRLIVQATVTTTLDSVRETLPAPSDPRMKVQITLRKELSRVFINRMSFWGYALTREIADAEKERPSTNTEQSLGTVENSDTNNLDAGRSPEDRSDNARRDNEKEEYVSDAESSMDILMGVEADTLHSPRTTRLEARIKKASKRFAQHVDYTRLMEDRVLNLEKRMRG